MYMILLTPTKYDVLSLVYIEFLSSSFLTWYIMFPKCFVNRNKFK